MRRAIAIVAPFLLGLTLLTLAVGCDRRTAQPATPPNATAVSVESEVASAVAEYLNALGTNDVTVAARHSNGRFDLVRARASAFGSDSRAAVGRVSDVTVTVDFGDRNGAFGRHPPPFTATATVEAVSSTSTVEILVHGVVVPPIFIDDVRRVR